MPKFLCLSLLLCSGLAAQGEAALRVRGEYFIYNDTLKIIFGSGAITLEGGGRRLRGDVLYYQVETQQGVLYGGETRPREAVYFQGVPPRFRWETLGSTVAGRGDESLRFQVQKPTLAEFKDQALYFEFRGFSVNPRGRVRADTVIPYVMGMASMPLRRFTLNRGRLNHTRFALQDLNYTRAEGLSLDTRLWLRLRPFQGDFSIKVYERELFRLPGIRRGLLYSGRLSLRHRDRDQLSFDLSGNTGDRTFNLTLSRRGRAGPVEYQVDQQFSGRQGAELFSEFRGRIAVTPFSGFRPEFSLRFNWKRSITYGLNAPLQMGKRLKVNLGMERRILREAYDSDQLEVWGGFDFQARWFSLDSNYRLTRDMLDAVNRHNFALHLPLAPLRLLGGNLSLEVTPFYLFNSFPTGDAVLNSSSPGIRLQLRSLGLLLPLGFELQPAFGVHHLWDGLNDDMTDFQTDLVLARRLGAFMLAASYGISSRFTSRGFWVEGTHTRNLQVSGTFQPDEGTQLRLRLIMDNDLRAETLTWNGQVRLPWDLRFSSFVIYYIRGDRFQTVEIFLEKTFKHKLRIQGGYSLALRKFFIKLLLV